MRIARAAASLALAALLVGCATPGIKEGAVLGTAAGAAVGAAANGSDGALAGGVLGAVIGALLGVWLGDPDARGPDSDGDQVSDVQDNCPHTPNKRQQDSDGDGRGDACSP